jgi:tetratricopeptide (TPR) repeat protein/tRNA A-37 threonylcarbamoyl transferase component Bud32
MDDPRRAPPPDDPRGRAVLALRQAAAVDPRFAPHVGLVLETRGVLGEGGMGTVYEVLDRRLGRVAALKVMRTAVPANDLDARRFVREAEVTARLDHPAIPPVHEAGTDATGRQYLLMRRIEGEALSRRVEAAHKDGGRPDRAELRALVEVLVKVCDAVAYAHSQGVVHRDLKPANVMVGRFGEVLVLDWGIVRLLGRAEDARVEALAPAQPGDDPQLTMAGGALGTPGYMPPEQIEDAPSVDARADVFALGAILCDLLTGQPPVVGATVVNVISATLQHRIARPRDRWPEVPPALDAIAAAALAPTREARTQSASALAADLRAWLADEPVAAYPEGPGARLARTLRRRPALLVAVVALALLAAGGSAATGFVARARSREQAAAAEAASAAAAESSVRAARDGLDRALASFGEAEEASGRGGKGGADETAALVSQALAAVPTTRAMLLQAARALDRVNRDADAARLLERAADEEATPPVLLWLHRLELQRRRANDMTTLTAPLRRLLDVARAAGDEKDPWLWVARAVERRDEGELEEAGRALDEAIQRSNTTTIRALRGELRLRRGDLAGATEDYQEGARLASENAVIWRLRLAAADAQVQAGDFAGAAINCQRAVELGANTDARYLLAVAKNRLGDASGALAALERSADRAAASPGEIAERALARWRLGDRPGAAADAARALAKEPTQSIALTVRGEERLVANDLAGAYQDLKAAYDGTDAGPVEALGVVAALQGDLVHAEEWLTAVVDVAVRPQARAHSFRGYVRLRRGDAKAALEDLDRAIELGSPGPFGPLAWKFRGLARAAAGDLVGAVADLRRYLDLERGGVRPESVADAQAALDQAVARLRAGG